MLQDDDVHVYVHIPRFKGFFTLHACARDKVIGRIVIVVVVDTKIVKSGDLGT